ncbi:MAG TPA: Uma2 family endonuclease [Nostocaceae cyanobacterium]|nr:Uma2 family endonuclease [Nostocaceae cyanobacterium]
MTLTTAKWSLEDYHRMIEVGLLASRQVELLNGEIIDMPPEGPEHAQISTDAADYLRQLLGQKALVRDAKPITIKETNSEPEPDLAKLIGIEIAYNRREKTKTRVCYASKGFSDKRAGKETEERIKRE